MTSQAELAKRFHALHQGGAFIIANAFDAGSARVLAGLGYPAVATSSGAFAGTLGRRDGKVTREEALAHARAVVSAVDVPVSADLENGFGHAPSFAAETVRLAAGTGLVGCTIEDATGEKDRAVGSPFTALVLHRLARRRLLAAINAAAAPAMIPAW